MPPQTNELKRLPEFEEILRGYEPSPESERTLRNIDLVLLTAPTGVGRNTIILELLKSGRYHFIISDTTRQPRVDDDKMEQNGVEYWFRSEEEVLTDLKAGQYLGPAIIHQQQVSGISIRELERASSASKIAVKDVTVVGVNSVMTAKPDTIAIFVLPPSFDEWLERIHRRGPMEPAELHRRLSSAVREFTAALECSYFRFIVNDTVEAAAERIDQLVKTGQTDDAEQARLRELTQTLLTQTKKFLANS